MRVGDLTDGEQAWATSVLEHELGGHLQARRGEVIDVLDGAALVAWRKGKRVGLLTFRADGDARTELAAIIAIERRSGVGSALVRALVERARAQGAREIRVTTTNDNLAALAFYQRLGFRLVELRAGAVDAARASLKPSIAANAANGIPLRDELELALDLGEPG
jgi:ribosomal protein S18 acetylase RimI-like enzyme